MTEDFELRPLFTKSILMGREIYLSLYSWSW